MDRRIARLAVRQHGVVTLAQLDQLDLGEDAAWSRALAGRLHRVHRGVYAVGHPVLAPKGRLLAAVLACGPDAFLSHRSAAALWGIAPARGASIDVSSPTRAGRRHRGVRVHRGGTAQACDLTALDGVPCTTIARTLLDLAGVMDRRALERACEQAEVLELFDLRAIEDVLARAVGRRGVRRLHTILAGLDRELAMSRSELERRFLALCRRHRLPSPSVNHWVALPDDGLEVDFLWPDSGLIAETDGQRFHSSRRAFEIDRRRDQLLTAAGYRVVRFTWRQVIDRPREVGATLQALLGRV